jgi:cytochrome-b5 reductase
MLAGGSGITPMLQVLNEVAKNADDATEVTLVYANRTPADILVRERLDEIVAQRPNVKLHLFVSGGADPDTFPGQVGRIGKDDIERLIPAHADDTVVFVCGPPPFMRAISGDKLPDKSQGPLEGILKELGYTSESVFKF